jgi:phage FluMu protein Com
VGVVAETPDTTLTYEVQCPHCNKTFTGEPAEGAAARYIGFKCPHCKLFVPFERADEQGRVEPT